jgi:hypothetical protein
MATRPHLHAEANPEVWDLLGPRVVRRRHLALHAAPAKAAGHEHAVGGVQLPRWRARGGGLGRRLGGVLERGRGWKSSPGGAPHGPTGGRATPRARWRLAPARRPRFPAAPAGGGARARAKARPTCRQLSAYFSGASPLEASSRCWASTLWGGRGVTMERERVCVCACVCARMCACACA